MSAVFASLSSFLVLDRDLLLSFAIEDSDNPIEYVGSFPDNVIDVKMFDAMVKSFDDWIVEKVPLEMKFHSDSITVSGSDGVVMVLPVRGFVYNQEEEED